MISKKEHSLTALYRAMPTTEIERRLAHEDLADVARSVAAQELVTRRVESPVAALPVVGRDLDPVPRDGPRIAMFIVGIAVFSAAAWVILPKEVAGLLILTISLPAVAALIGKAAPVPAGIVGFILLATPLWLGAFMWYRGDLDWKSGDYRPLETLIMWGALGLISLVGMGIGGSLIAGAQHKGSWEDLTEELDRKKEDGVEDAKRLY